MSREIDSPQWVERQLVSFIQHNLPSTGNITVSNLRRMPSGLSRENWLFDALWNEAGVSSSHQLIMRRDPLGSVLETDRSTEFAVLKALADSPIPCPTVYWADLSGDTLGRPAIIMQRYDGLNDHFVLNGGLSHMDAQRRLALAKTYCETLAALHCFDWQNSALKEVFTSPGLKGAQATIAEWESYFFRQIQRPQPEMIEVLCWLKEHAPTAQATVVVHGDYKPGNTLIKDGDLQVVLDWETVHLGDPLEDIGWVTNPLRSREHLIPGIWEQADLIRHYEKNTGFVIDNEALHFWNVFANFKLNAILLTGVKSFRENRSDRPWVEEGLVTRLMANMIGW